MRRLQGVIFKKSEGFGGLLVGTFCYGCLHGVSRGYTRFKETVEAVELAR